MNELPTSHDTPPEPQSTSTEKPAIRVSQEEYVDDLAGPSMDRSEYEQRAGQGQDHRPADASEESDDASDQR